MANTPKSYHYLPDETPRARYLSRIFTESANFNIFVSSEPDRRYEWLEYSANKSGDNTRVIRLPNVIFQKINQFYLDKYDRGAIGFDRNMPGFETDRFACQECLRLVVETIQSEYSPDAMVSASVGDIRWRETIIASRECGVPWVVTEREGVIAPVVYDVGWEVVQNSFNTEVDLLCASNQRHLNYWDRIGIGDGDLVLTGDLKSEFWQNLNFCRTRKEISRRIEEDKILILYFAFGSTNYIDDWLFPEVDSDWSSLQEAHFEVLYTIAREYPDDVQVIIKGGHPGDLEKYTRDSSDSVPDNVLALGSEYQALDLIYNSDIIVGFQTTALIESMFTKAPILFGGWGDLYDNLSDNLIPLHRTDGVVQPGSKRELYDLLEKYVTDPSSRIIDEDMMEARRNFRRNYYENVGSTGERTYQAIKSVAQENRSSV